MTANWVLNFGSDGEPVVLYGESSSKILIDKDGNVYVRLSGNLVHLV